MAAATMASRLGFSYDHIEDLRVAVDELCFCLTGSRGRPGRIVLTYTVDPDGLRIEGTGPAAEQAVDPPVLSELSQRILDAVVDEHGIEAHDGAVRFHLLKRPLRG
jgi:hypothetical protein